MAAVSGLAHSTRSLFAKSSIRAAREGWLLLHRKRSLVVFAVAFALAAFNAGEAMASPPGQITGTVTNAVTNAPISHIVACVREAGGSHKEECGESRESTGEYEITGVPPGQYRVLFYPNGLAYYDYYAGQYVSQYDVAQYLSQYYPGVPVWSEEAQPVSVVEGAVTSGVNAQMREGGWITGRVTAAGSGTPLEGVEVCSRDESGPWLVSSCTDTNAHGEYAYFYALEPALYKIEFRPSEKMGYQQQYYKEVPLLSEALPVIIESGKTIAGIDAALQPASAPAGEGEPPEVPSSPGGLPGGTGGIGPVTAPYLGSANEQFRVQVVEPEAQRQKAKELEEQKAREAADAYTAEQAALKQHQEANGVAVREAGKHPACVVPSLKGDTLAAARSALVKAHCRLGRVSRPAYRGSAPRVISQTARHGKRLPAGASIAVVLGSRRA